MFRKKSSAIKLSYMITFVNGIREGVRCEKWKMWLQYEGGYDMINRAWARRRDPIARLPAWRNGRRIRLKIWRGQPRAGSSPAAGILGRGKSFGSLISVVRGPFFFIPVFFTLFTKFLFLFLHLYFFSTLRYNVMNTKKLHYFRHEGGNVKTLK